MKRSALPVILSALALAACGGQRLDALEPHTNFTVSVPRQSFPATQTMSEHTHLVLAIRNDSNRTIPDVAVTICNVTCLPGPGQSYTTLAKAGEGVYAQPFATGRCDPNHPGCLQPAANNASTTPPSSENPAFQIWVIDKPPGPCTGREGYSCAGGSFGGNVSYDANTWQKGPLKPGATTTFDWAVTAVKPGHWKVGWVVSAGLSGKAKALLPDGSMPHGTFPVTITTTPGQSYVDNNGQIVQSPNGR
jgi:hypothetical protein